MKHVTICLALGMLFSPVALGQPLRCPDLHEGIPSKARREFVEPYAAGTAALQAGRFPDAIAWADAAVPNAIDAMQLQAALKIRSAALLAMHDAALLVPTLELRLKTGCHQSEGDAEKLAAELEAARTRSTLQRE